MYPKIVWSFWHSEPPESVASIIESNKNVLTNWDVRFLKHTNLLIPLPKNLASVRAESHCPGPNAMGSASEKSLTSLHPYPHKWPKPAS